MADADDLIALLDSLSDLPVRNRVAPAEQAVRLSDELGYVDLQARARLKVVEAYEFAEVGPKSFTPFAWLLQRYEEKPSWFTGPLLHSFLWEFKWMTGAMLNYPEVPLARIEENLRAMYRVYAECGEGLAPVHRSAFQLARQVRGVAGAEREFETWVAADRTDLSDCAACEPNMQATYRAQQGRWDDAIDLALAGLQSGKTCSEEPSGLYATVVEPLLVVGRADEALVCHRRGWRLAADEPLEVVNASVHVLTLARAGAVDRGVAVLASRIDRLDSTTSPYDRMQLAAAGTRLLDAASAEYGMGGRTMRYQQRDWSFDELRAYLRSYTLDLAQRFDARNGTPEVGRFVAQRWLQASYLPPLPVPEAATPPPEPVKVERHPLAPDVTHLGDLSVERLSDLVELALRYAPNADMALLSEQWLRRRSQLAALREGADATRLAALAQLEYLVAWSDLRITAERAAPYLVSAAGLYREAGNEAEALVVEQWLALRRGDFDQAIAMIASIDVVGDLAQRGRARLRALPTMPSEQRAGVLEEVASYPCSVDSDQQLRRVWATAHSSGGSPEELYERSGLGLGMLLPGEYADTQAGLHAQRATACAILGRPEEVVAELNEAMRHARLAGDEVLARVTLTRAMLALMDGRPEDAEPLLREAAALADRADLWDTAAEARWRLADLLRQTGRQLEGAEIAEGALAALDLARVSDRYLDWTFDAELAKVASLCGQISTDLEESSRAASLYKRAAELCEVADDRVSAGQAWGDYAAAVRSADSLEAVRAYRLGISMLEAADEQRGVMALRRQLPFAVNGTDGLDAALRELEVTVAANDDNEARFLTDTEFRERLGNWDFTYERLDLADTRARLYAANDRTGDAITVLGDVPEQLFAHGAESQGLNSRLLRARLLFSVDRVDDGIAQLEHILSVLRTWDDQESTINDMAGIGARALLDAGREAEADAFWEKNRVQSDS